MINGNTIVNLTDRFPQEFTSKTYTSHTGDTGSYTDVVPTSVSTGPVSRTTTQFSGHRGDFYSDALRSTFSDVSFYDRWNSTIYNEKPNALASAHLSYWTTYEYTGNVLGVTYGTINGYTYNNAQSWPFTPTTNTTINETILDSTRRTTYGQTDYTANGTTTSGFTSFYTDTDTIPTTGTYGIVTYGAIGTSTDSGFYTTTASKTDVSTSSTRRTITTDSSLRSTTFTSFYTLGQTTVPAYWANYNERLAYVLPVSGYPRDVVEWSVAYSDLGTKIDAGAQFPSEGANFLTSVYDTQTEIKTKLKTTTTNTTSFQAFSLWPTHNAEATYHSTSSSTVSTTYQEQSVDTDGKLFVYSSTSSHPYTNTYTLASTIPVTISLTTATTSEWTGGFYTEARSKLGNITYSLSGGRYIMSKNGNEITYLTTYGGSNNSVDAFSLANVVRLSTQYTTAENVAMTYYGGPTYITSDTGFYSYVDSYLSDADSTVTQAKIQRSDMLSVGGTTSSIPFTQAFGLAQTYQTAAGITPSGDMSYDNGFGLGFSIPANISFVDFTTSSVYNGGVMLTTATGDLYKASQSIDSVSATTYGTSIKTTGTGTGTGTVSTTDASLTTSYSGLINTEISWDATHYTNNLILAGEGEASFANNGFDGDVDLHIRGVYKITTFDPTGGEIATYKSTYAGDNTISITGGDGLVLYKGGTKLLTLGFSSVASTFRSITKFTKT